VSVCVLSCVVCLSFVFAAFVRNKLYILFSVMTALICILRGLPKDARVASFRFLKSIPRV